MCDLEELVEDAFAAYLKTIVTGDARIECAWETLSAQFPRVVVFCGQPGPVSDGAEFTYARKMMVTVSVMVEPIAKISDGVETLSIREVYRNLRGQVIGALSVPVEVVNEVVTDSLLTRLQAAAPSRIGLSMSQYIGAERTVEEDPRKMLITLCEVEIIAEPKEESA